MIPAPVFSNSFFVVLAISFLAFALVVTWAIALAIIPGARRSFARHRARSVSLLTLLCFLSLFYVLLAVVYVCGRVEVHFEEAARHPTLKESMKFEGVDMPAGTKLSLRDAKDMSSVERAEFPHPVDVYGIKAMTLKPRSERNQDVSIGDASGLDDLPAMELTVAGTSVVVDGWRCAPNQPLEIVLPHGEIGRALWLCYLAPGNTVSGASIPANSRVIRASTVYGDGLRDNDYWRVDVVDSGVFELHGLPLTHPMLTLDRDMALASLSYTELAHAASLGDLTYPAGTEVSSAGRGLREDYPGTFVFSPPDGHSIVSKAHGEIRPGTSVLQKLDGQIYGTISFVTKPDGKTTADIGSFPPGARLAH
jgi:hypothetical protein